MHKQTTCYQLPKMNEVNSEDKLLVLQANYKLQLSNTNIYGKKTKNYRKEYNN